VNIQGAGAFDSETNRNVCVVYVLKFKRREIDYYTQGINLHVSIIAINFQD